MAKYSMDELKDMLYTGLICDVLDKMGYHNQYLGPDLMPITFDTVVFGKVFTCIATEVYSMPEDPLTAQCRVIDQMHEGEVMVLTTRGNYTCAILGELMATAITVKGGRGAILDGMCRDLKAVRNMNFPLIYRGRMPNTSKGRAEVNECQVPIKIDNVTINPGDYVFGDIDGVVFIPGDLLDQVIEAAVETETSENKVRDLLTSGNSLQDTYSKIGTI